MIYGAYFTFVEGGEFDHYITSKVDIVKISDFGRLREDKDIETRLVCLFYRDLSY